MEGTSLKTEYDLTPNLWINWYTRDDVNFVYIPVHRCATNWMISQLTTNGFYEVTPAERESIKHKERLVIIREPTERVLSGMFVPDNIDYAILDTDISQQELESILSKDIHTSGQVKYLPKDNGNYVYFNLDKTLPSKIDLYLSSHGLNLGPGLRTWTKVPVGAKSREHREKVFNNPKLLNMFKEFLKEDYELYNSVKFYGTN